MSTLDQAFVKAFEPVFPSEADEPIASSPPIVGPRESSVVRPDAARVIGSVAAPPEVAAVNDTLNEAISSAAEKPAVEAKKKPSPARRSRQSRRVSAGRSNGRSASIARSQAKRSRERPSPAQAERHTENAVRPAAERFRPLLEVDAYLWPKNVGKLVSRSQKAMGEFVRAVREHIQRGQKTIGFQGCRRGDGCSTLLLAVARRLAESGLRVAMLDADFEHPILARRLGLEPLAGWEVVAPGRFALAEVVVESLRDGLSLAPWCAPPASKETSVALRPAEAIRCMDELRRNYDAVLVDLGSAGSPNGESELSAAVRSRLDAILVVRRADEVPSSELEAICRKLARSAAAELAVVENFV